MNLQMDFVSDWTAILAAEISGMGYTLPAGATNDDVALLYLNALKRRIPAAPRTVIRSKEFTCPAAEQVGLAALESKVRAGTDIKPHLSRLLKRLSFDDSLLNDWGVYHIHLGTVLEADGYIQRTGPVLFALITGAEFYEINVFPHQQWSNLDVVEIIHGNWPNLISKYRLPVAGPPQHVPTSVDITALRKGNVNANIVLKDGAVYAPIGGGYANDGTSNEVVFLKNRLKKSVLKLQKLVEKDLQRITTDLASEGCPAGSTVTVKLEQEGNRWVGRFPGFQYVLNFGQLKLT